MRPALVLAIFFVLLTEAHAQPEDAQAEAHQEVWQRILIRLDELPGRWDALGEPAVLRSTHTPHHVLAAATEAETEAARALIWRLALTKPELRAHVLEETRTLRPLTEVDLWLPLVLARAERTASLDRAALVVDAWLELAERLGRRDVLLDAAAFALHHVRFHLPPLRLVAAAGRWMTLSAGTGAPHGAASLARARGHVLLRVGLAQAALEAFRQARQLHRGPDDPLCQAQNWLGEGEAEIFLGRNHAALLAGQQARKLFAAAHDSIGLGYTSLGQAVILSRLGQSAAALAAFREARAGFAAVGDRMGLGHGWFGEASVLAASGEKHAARAAFREARAMFVAVSSALSEANTWEGEANVLLQQGHDHEALEAFRRARGLYTSVDDPVGLGLAWAGEARALLLRDALPEALRAAEKAVALAEKMRVSPNVIDALGLEARIRLRLGDEHGAVERARDALAHIESWRKRGISEVERAARANWSGPHDILIPLLARKPDQVEEALTMADAAHAPVFLDHVTTKARRPGSAGDLALRAERTRLQRTRTMVDRELGRTIAPPLAQELLQRVTALDAELELDELVALGAMKSPFLSGELIDAGARRELVHEQGAILLYYTSDSETVGFLLTPDRRSPLVRHLPLAREQLRAEVEALRHDLGNPLWEPRARARQRALHDALIGPFAQALAGTPRLTIIPHGPLHGLPFEGLLTGDGKALFELWDVTIAPSLSALHALHQRRAESTRDSRRTFVGMAGGTGLRLPDRELQDIAGLFGSVVSLIGRDEGTFDAYTALAPGADHLLITTHGQHVSASRSGYLEITPSETHDRRLTAAEIAEIPLQAELVTLAACDTARAEALLSDERPDLTRAFLIAGAGAVLATRWKVPEDESTRRFLLDFYHALLQGGPNGTGLRKDEALTEARRRSLARGDHAQLWAAWVLVGDAR